MQLPERVVTPLEGVPAAAWDEAAPIAAPLQLHRCRVEPRWVDYNRHMSESCYLLVVGDNADAFFRYLGIDESYRAQGRSYYTVETHLRHLREVAEGETLDFTLHLLDFDAKRLHLFHRVRLGDTDTHTEVATAEQMLVHVDSAEGRAAAVPEEIHRRLTAIREAHRPLEMPEERAGPMGIRRTEPHG